MKLAMSAIGLGLLVLAGASRASADDGDEARSADRMRTYQVTIANKTTGQWLTPAVVATHRQPLDVFTVGRRARFEVKEIAENGNVTPLLDLANASRFVSSVQLVPSPSGPPAIGPGAHVTFEINADDGARFLSWVSMLICTNDGFTGLDAVRLPVRVGHTATFRTAAYEAGTERNTEAWADLVPPCAQLTGFGDQGGTGTSDSALAEGGVIRIHRGITGIADLVPGMHGWTNPVATVTVTRTR